ncbi:MAG: [LysW]-aminoadipate/[LysW]-glutamate kinase [Conexivisphaera sp.]
MIVVKVGGSLVHGGFLGSILDDIARMSKDRKVVLVHGGGAVVTEVAERMGVKQQFVTSPTGIRSRYTDKETAGIFAMVMAGRINTEIVASLRARGVDAFGLSGVDGGLILAERKKRLVVIDEKGRKRAIDGGYTGRIVEVRPHVLEVLIGSGFTPVISPVAIGQEGEVLNVDADRAAAYVASAIKAEALVLLTNVAGLLDERGALVKELTATDARDRMKKVGPGMDKKLLAAAEALEGGVGKVMISDGRIESPIGRALEGAGTVVRRES